jgi:hypothetical protein
MALAKPSGLALALPLNVLMIQASMHMNNVLKGKLAWHMVLQPCAITVKIIFKIST